MEIGILVHKEYRCDHAHGGLAASCNAVEIGTQIHKEFSCVHAHGCQSSTKELTQYEQISHMRTRVYGKSVKLCGWLGDKIPCTLILKIGSLVLHRFLSADPDRGYAYAYAAWHV